MTPQEIHIAIDLGLQKTGSFAYDNIKPEFIDLIFNRMGDAYITEKTTKPLDPKNLGFEETQARTAIIRELITEATLSPEIDVTDKRQGSVLPHNYFTFIEAQTTVIESCTNQSLEYDTTTISEHVAVAPFKKSNFSSPPTNPFDNLIIYTNINGGLSPIFTFSSFGVTITDLDEIFTVINMILDTINQNQPNGIKVYYEHYRGVYYPQSLIFVSTSATLLNQAMHIRFTNSSTADANFITRSYTIPSIGEEDSAEKDTFCRLLSSEESFHMLAHPFGTTSPDSPILNIVGDRLIAYINKRFILKSILLKYIRKPRRMSLPLNQSYELQDSRALAKIIDMTVEYLSATIQSQTLPALVSQNQQRD